MEKKYSILYVDDEESNLRIFKDIFRRKFNVYTALSAKEGISILEEHRIDLVLSDQRMPDMTGVEFLKYALERYPHSNRILITGFSDEDAMERAINQAHVFQYIRKPWDEDMLERIIEDALRIYELEQQNIQHQESLKQALEKAEESDRLKTEFLHNLSHEIRTPLNAIIGFSDFLEDDDLDSGTRKEYVNIIKKSGDQLLHMIELIIEISRLETSQVMVYEKEVNLNWILDKLYQQFEKLAKEKNIEFKVHKPLPDSEAMVITDEDKVNKILHHLLENAFKFTPSGKIEFGYEIKDDVLELFVKDTGMGIHPDSTEAIFKSFSQENKKIVSDSGGLGLGLSIAKGYVELMQGDIIVESEEGKGATFIVTLPLKTA